MDGQVVGVLRTSERGGQALFSPGIGGIGSHTNVTRVVVSVPRPVPSHVEM